MTFFYRNYLNTNLDVAAGYIGSPEQHYIDHGRFEGRAPTPYIDETPYLITTIDSVQLSGVRDPEHDVISI